MTAVPEKPTLDGLEQKWRARWEAAGTYHFDRTMTRDQIYSVDTPPPTVSGRLHIGSCSSYTHTDLVVRYQRMRGREVFYPMGWDDNGLNVERRVQIMRGIVCDPSLPYDPDFRPPDPPADPPIPVSRPNFIEQCLEVTELLEADYHELWSTLGLSVDWRYTYRTIGPEAVKPSQHSFLRLLDRGLVYRLEAPTLWDVDFRSAIAQAELQDREIPGAYHQLRFRHAASGDPIVVDTTRPELVAACVALVAHPTDERYRALIGQEAVTPLFGARVPIVAHELADPEKGTGIAMICTFGDTTDVTWWRELGLPVRATVDRDGTMRPVSWGEPGWECDDPSAAQAAYNELVGRPVKAAQRRIVEVLRASGDLIGEPRPVRHAVKFWENGTKPLEIVTSNQWFIKYPPRDELLKRGEELRWWPEFMRVRYDNWVNGLIGDWNITRQRFFGVPFPIWYPIDEEGVVQLDAPIPAELDTLPIDPSTDAPPGYSEEQRGKPRGFAGDPDVMDTWATSSLSPQVVSGWLDDPDLFGRVFPMDLRPQAHDIIRTWLFYTVVRSHYEHDSLPFTNAAISGFVIDPDRKKLSKSADTNEDAPMTLIGEFGADAVRYWAANGRPGTDRAFDRNQFKIGRRLAIKLLNASRFALGLGDPGDDAVVDHPLDRSILARLAAVVDEVTAAFEQYDYSRALERIETFFWSFCDDHLELVKGRAYGARGPEAQSSAQAALRVALGIQLRLFAPFLPYVTDEVWSWWRDGSVHVTAWPAADELVTEADGDADPRIGEVAGEVLSEIRKAKTAAKKSLRADVSRVFVRAPTDVLVALAPARDDLAEAGRVAELVTEEAAELSVEVTLA
ncbi:MAG: valine--tRNA ligase [Acidimicrobiales bacterium]